MAGINPDISTSSFKPLSLDEIMMVPLAKQKQEDQAQLALDEFAALESQALGPDKDYVSGQIQAFKKEAGSLSDQLMENGVDKSLINKVRGLRNRKSNELSLEGKTGQAAAAYNQYKENEKNIMNRKDLTADQKRLGLQEALANYKGVTEGSQYQDYVGTAHIDIMKRGRDIAAKMTPQEIAKATGVTIDENGYYRDGSYVYKTLPAHHIEKVIKQALQGDQDLMAYANELERLGIANAEEEIIKSAQSAGNVFQRKDMNEKATLLSAKMQPNALDPNKGIIDDTQPWDTMDITYQDGIWNESFNMPTDIQKEKLFVDGMLPESVAIADEEAEAKLKADRDSFVADAKEAGVSWKDLNDMMIVWDMKNKSQAKKMKEFNGLRESINALRENNPVLQSNKPAVMNPDGSIKEPSKPWTDEEIYDIYKNGALKAEKTMSKVVKPVNPSSTFIKLGEDLIGSGDRNGNFPTKHMKLAGHPSGGKDVIASQLDLEPNEFNEVVRRTGRVIGFAPGHIEMPGAFAVQIELEDGSTPIVYMQNDGKPRQMLGSISKMNEAIKTGTNYVNNKVRGGDGSVVNEMIVTELNPQTKSYEAATIRSKTEYTKEELDQMNFQRVQGSGAVQLALNDDGTPIEPKVFKLMYDDEMQRSINNVTRFYDKAPAGNQVLGKSQKNQ